MLSGDAQVLTLGEGPKLVIDLAGAGLTKVYTWDGERVTVGEVEILEDSRLSIPQAITLDDGTTLKVCSETMLLTRSGAPRYPEQIEAGDSLLPLYTKTDGNGYLIYQEPGVWHKCAKTTRDGYRWRPVSRMVAEWKMERRCAAGDVVSFISKDRTNCHPDNLKISRKPRKKMKRSNFADPIIRAHRFIRRHNHGVTEVRIDISRDLFSIRGVETANLAVDGIFLSVDSE
jgi:hypothetical protein